MSHDVQCHSIKLIRHAKGHLSPNLHLLPLHHRWRAFRFQLPFCIVASFTPWKARQKPHTKLLTHLSLLLHSLHLPFSLLNFSNNSLIARTRFLKQQQNYNFPPRLPLLPLHRRMVCMPVLALRRLRLRALLILARRIATRLLHRKWITLL